MNCTGRHRNADRRNHQRGTEARLYGDHPRQPSFPSALKARSRRSPRRSDARLPPRQGSCQSCAKMHGEQIHQEALNNTIREAMDKLVADKALRPAMNPDVALGDGYEEGKDAELTVSLEVLPEIEAPSLDGLQARQADRPGFGRSRRRIARADCSPAAALRNQGRRSRRRRPGDLSISPASLTASSSTAARRRKQPIVIGSGRLIPGFEEQLIGMKAGTSVSSP